MNRTSYPLKMPLSAKTAAARLAKADGVSLNQFIAAAIAEKVGAIETADAFLKLRTEKAKPADLLRFLTPHLAPSLLKTTSYKNIRSTH